GGLTPPGARDQPRGRGETPERALRGHRRHDPRGAGGRRGGLAFYLAGIRASPAEGWRKDHKCVAERQLIGREHVTIVLEAILLDPESPRACRSGGGPGRVTSLPRPGLSQISAHADHRRFFWRRRRADPPQRVGPLPDHRDTCPTDQD